MSALFMIALLGFMLVLKSHESLERKAPHEADSESGRTVSTVVWEGLANV
jgi:hypothetical protein